MKEKGMGVQDGDMERGREDEGEEAIDPSQPLHSRIINKAKQSNKPNQIKSPDP